MTLPKQRRLKESATISRAFSKTHVMSESGISARVLDSKKPATRFVVVVPAKNAPLAVQRNAIRRKTTEALRHIISKTGIISGKDVVFTVRALPTDPGAIEKTLVLLMKKSGILHQ